MASPNPFFRDGDSNNKPPLFISENYDFWKICIQAYLEAEGREIWDDVKNGPYIQTTIINDVEYVKIKAYWTDDDKKKVLYDKKAKNMIQATLNMDKFFHVYQCKTSKEIWDTQK